MMKDIPNKVLLMGLAAAGKSSIHSIIFEGKTPAQVKNYEATVNYVRSTQSIITSDLQIFDLGGQESFINAFVGEMAEFIFSDVQVLVWIVDISDSQHISTSKFYFDHAIQKLNEHSKNADVFCLFHKMDLIKEDLRKQVLESMKGYFISEEPIKIHYYGTSIFDVSLFDAMGKVIQKFVYKSDEQIVASDKIKQYLSENNHLLGISLFSREGIAVFEAGEHISKLSLPANLFLSVFHQFQDNSGEQTTLQSVFKTDNYIFLFQKFDSNALLTGISDKNTPVQYASQALEDLKLHIRELL